MPYFFFCVCLQKKKNTIHTHTHIPTKQQRTPDATFTVTNIGVTALASSAIYGGIQTNYQFDCIATKACYVTKFRQYATQTEIDATSVWDSEFSLTCSFSH